MSSFVSWDSKITTVNAILGGVTDLVRQKMKGDGIYDEFVSVTQVSEIVSLLLSQRGCHTTCRDQI
jgi:hypothetical protein